MSADRESLKEGERGHAHSQSASFDYGRALIPMWDSSDPERAPPPLPLNPQSPSVSPRKGASSAIQSAHATLAEKARENNATPTPIPRREGSPDKSLVKSSHHKRMQSLQPGTVRDLSFLLENGPSSAQPSPSKSERPSRPSTPSRAGSGFSDSKSFEAEPVASPTPGSSLTPVVRPTARRPQQSILGDNTPPQSATMLALHSKAAPVPKEAPGKETETPLANFNNGSSGSARAPQGLEALSNQILSLTNIATALQKDMSQLSRRSRDNAADLLSLKEATNLRDEDIRRGLRDVISNFHETGRASSFDSHSGAGLFLDSKPHYYNASSPAPKATRPFSLPRLPSPNSFAASVDRESESTPSLCNHDAPSTIAILEKILKDMGTKEGHDLLLDRLAEVSDRIAGMASAKKLEELISLNKDMSIKAAVTQNRAVSRDDQDFDHPSRTLDVARERGQSGALIQRPAAEPRGRDGRQSASTGKGAELINDDFIKTIRTIKDSVAQSGGLTAEVKALVRELRGEVLGMGREIGRRLEEVNQTPVTLEDVSSKPDVATIVDQGLHEMKEQMNELVREHRRQSTASAASRAPAVDYQEIYNAMRTALKDSQASQSKESVAPDFSTDDVIHAVREAWESYKPEVEVNDHGLGKEQVLEYLKEGLQDHAREEGREPGATRDEVFQAVVEGLKHFVPPRMDSEASLSRDEILEAVRECLEEFEFPVAPSAINAELTRDDMVEAVKEGLTTIELPQATSQLKPASDSDDLASRLQEIMDFMRHEFEAVSEEAKQNMAANGRDTEQVLDATKDGLDKLRVDLEEHINEMMQQTRSASGQEDQSAMLAESLNGFRDEVAALVTNLSVESKDMIESRMDSLQETVNTSLAPATPLENNSDILETVRSGLDEIRAQLHQPLPGNTEVLDALHEGLAELRMSIDKVGDRPMDLTANDEILEVLKAGLDSVRTDIDGLRQQSREQRAVTTMHDHAVVPAEPAADALRQDDIKNLEILITQLRIKVEAIVPETQAAASTENMSKDDLSRLEDMMSRIQESVDSINVVKAEVPGNSDHASREDVEAIETILRNTKARLDDLIDGEQAVRKEHLDSLGSLISETRESMVGVATQLESLPQRSDVTTVESLVSQIAAGFEEMRERATRELEDPERVTKTDVDAVEAACLDIKNTMEECIKANIAAVASAEDMGTVNTSLEELKARLETIDESSTKASDERQAEVVGVGERVSDVKALLEDFQELTKGKLEEGGNGIEALSKLLQSVSETIDQNGTVGQDLKELSDAMKAEFEESKAGVVGAKLDTDEKFQQVTNDLGLKIDEKVTELLTKYDELQAAADERSRAGEARDIETEAALLGTKTVADELKSLVDTLGTAVTDSLEKMEEASKTVFNKVEELATRTDENYADGKVEQQQTRDQVKLAVETIEGLQSQIGDYSPQILDAIKEVLQIVGQHYEHSKSTTSDIGNKLDEAKTMRAEPPPMLPPAEKYDDTVIHEKLDKLVDHTQSASRAFSQLDVLDQVHQQVNQTAAEISTFLVGQAKQITEASEDKERSLHETEVALERQLAHKEQTEANLASLKVEEDQLKTSVMALRAEQELMTRHKTKLTADVSSLETALRLRREELQDMEARAEGLERRILEGVMDHSRVLLMSKAAKNQETMNRKRVKVHKPNGAVEQPRPPTKQSVPIALSAKRNLGPPSQNPQARRILSLSQINNNVASPGVARSQSVRTPAGVGRGFRKSSWAGGVNRETDKENISARGIDEEPEPDSHDAALMPPPNQLSTIEGSLADDSGDETSTLRRSSYGTTIITEGMTDSVIGEGDHGTELSYTDDEDGLSDYTVSGLESVDGAATGSNEMVVHGHGLEA